MTDRYGPVTADQTLRKVQEFLGKVAGQDDPVVDRAETRGISTLGKAVENCMAANPKLSNWTDELYCYEATAAKRALAQLLPMDYSSISRDSILQSAAL